MVQVTEVGRARALAQAAHWGQKDKAGKPYIAHPGRVVGHFTRRAVAAGLSVEETWAGQAAAWLHDVVEDTEITLETIAAMFSPRIAHLVDLMTKRKGQPRSEYYARVATDPVAVLLKGADMDDNTDPSRVAGLVGIVPEADQVRLAKKYAWGYETLGLTSHWAQAA